MKAQRAEEELKDAILEQLRADARVAAEQVEVLVSDGQVTLRGAAPSYRAKWAAAEAARRVWGVFGVANEIQVRVAAPVADERIAADVRSALMRDADLDSSHINVEVEGGRVRLSGAVSTTWARSRAEEDARWTRGVVHVANELTVVPTRAAGDREIAVQVERALQRDAAVHAANIGVVVADRHVTLSGVVASWAERSAALEDAMNVPGVSDVRDELALQYRRA